MLWYEVASNALYYITLPIVKLLLLVIYFLRLLLSPLIYIVQIVVQLGLIPYNIAARFEAVWYFVGSAIIVGLICAFVLHTVFRTSVFILNLDRQTKPKPKDVPAKGPDVKSYRKAREKRKREAEKEQQELDARARALARSPLLKDALSQMKRESAEEANLSPSTRKVGVASLFDQTILEHSAEEDS